MIVVDASVAAKWQLPEPGQAEADALLRDSSSLLAPALIRLEVAGAIARRVRVEAMPIEEARERYQSGAELLLDGGILLLPDGELLGTAVELSLRLRHGLQDCLYLAAARTHHVLLITADRIFHARARREFSEVRLLPGLLEQ